MCSLKREVKVKVTKFCIGREELINVDKLKKFDLRIINGLWETKLNATAKHESLTPDRQRDGRTDTGADPGIFVREGPTYRKKNWQAKKKKPNKQKTIKGEKEGASVLFLVSRVEI